MVRSANDGKTSLVKSPSAPPAPSRGDELVLQAAHDTEQLVCARGALFLVTERHGDVTPRGARELGLFSQDTRHLSHLELRIADVELVHLSAETSHDAFNQIDLMVSGIEEGGVLDDPQNYLHVRRRQLLDDGLVEEITLTNFLSHPVRLELALRFDADFADIFEVRGERRASRGTSAAPAVAAGRVTHSYDGLDGVRYATEFAFSPTPSRLEAHEARFELDLEAGGTREIEFSVTPRRGEARAMRPGPAFEQRIGSQLAETRRFREGSTLLRSDNALLERVFDQATADLSAMRIEIGPASVVAAGIPWFCCPFGRDALLASYEALLLNPDLAVQSLRTLARFQGQRDDDVTEEEPGKIFHELRVGEMANTGEIPHSPYYGSVDATPLFVVVLDATYRVTGDVSLVRELRESLLAALGWIDRQSENGTGFVRYRRRSPHGLDNQGWKDSRAGVSFPNGQRAEPPIALCEVQGYCVDAYTRGARLLHVLGDAELAERYAARAEALRALTNERMWLAELGRYAFAIDGRDRALPTVVSNVGHLLWSRVAPPDRARDTAKLLLSPSSFSGFGIRTLATGQPVYNPLSYHNGTVWPHDNAVIAKGFSNYRFTELAARVFDGLLEAMRYFRDRRLPELFCGMPQSSGNLVRYPVACSPQAWASAAPFLLLQAVLGLHLDAPRRRLHIRNACLPASMGWVELEGLRIGGTRASLRLRRDGERVHIERLDVTGPAIRTEVEID
jgi:glycogen debranching enzyme